MKERLQKILSSRGLTSRRKAEEWIQAGKVTVNGFVARLGDTADPEADDICVNGRPLPKQEKYVYILLNKPRGFVTTMSDEKGRANVSQLVADCPVRVYPVGRLDMDSEGLLLLTNDGEFANRMMHPSHRVDKTYETWVTDYSPSALERLQKPMELDGYLLHRPKVKLLKSESGQARLLITIHEGRNRQVRRMCEIAGMKVTRLRRIREGALQLGDLPKGKWRYLMPEEIEKMK